MPRTLQSFRFSGPFPSTPLPPKDCQALDREVLRDRSRESLRFDGKKVPAFWAHLGLGDHGLGKG